MLILFVLLLVTHQVAGQLQCPQVSASFKNDIDFSSFAVSLAIDQSEGMGVDGNASGDDQCKSSVSMYTYISSKNTFGVKKGAAK